MNAARGMSLTELLVAVALLATATAGGLGAFAHARNSYRDVARLQHQHELAQYVFATLEPELQMAGYFGGEPPSAIPADDIPAPASRCGPDIPRRLDRAIEVARSWTLACEARNGAMPGSDVLIIRRAASRLAAGPEEGRAQWITGPASPGMLYWNGEASAPGAPPESQELRRLIVDIYYVSQQSDGDARVPALRVKSLSSIAGVPAFIDTEVMPGVETLHVEIQPAADAPRSALVRLRIRADPADPADPADQTTGVAATIELSRAFSLRNATR